MNTHGHSVVIEIDPYDEEILSEVQSERDICEQMPLPLLAVLLVPSFEILTLV